MLIKFQRYVERQLHRLAVARLSVVSRLRFIDSRVVTFSEARSRRWVVETVSLLFVTTVAILSYVQGNRYLWFLGRREVDGAPDKFLTSHSTWFLRNRVATFPESFPELLQYAIAPVWTIVIILLGSALAAYLVHGARRGVQASSRPRSDRSSARAIPVASHWLKGFSAVLAIGVWCAALGVTMSAIQTSAPPETPRPNGAFAVSTTQASENLRQWQEAQIYFPPTMVLDADDRDTYFVFGVTVPRGQRPEISLWLPSAKSEDRVSFEGGASKGTEALSGCAEFRLTAVRSNAGHRLTRASCVLSNGAGRHVEEIGNVVSPDYRPVVIRVGGYPRFAWTTYPQGGRISSAVAVSDYPDGGASIYEDYGVMPLSHVDTSEFGIAATSVSGVGQGGNGASVSGFFPSVYDGQGRIEPAVAVLASGGSREFLPLDATTATYVGKLLLFRGQVQPTQEWQALIEEVQQLSVQQVETANTIALILLGTAPFGAFIAARRRGL